jgi:hypothetical protein
VSPAKSKVIRTWKCIVLTEAFESEGDVIQDETMLDSFVSLKKF